jgi:Domain of unknown function (DUF927)
MSQNLPIPLRKGAEQHASEQTAQMRAWLRWAKETLGLKNANDDTADYGGEYRQGSQLDKLRLAATRKELEAIEFDKDDSDVIEALDNIVGPGRKKRPKHFENASEGRLLRYLSGRFKDAKKFFRDKLFRDEVTKAAETEAYERAEENARFYGEFRQYKVTDGGGVFEQVTDDPKDGLPSTKWVQISGTRIDLLAVTRSKKDDDWGVYIKLRNMDGRDTLKSIPRSIITDLKGSVAADLAELGADIIRDQIGRLPVFLLTTVENIDDRTHDLVRHLAVPTTGWCQLANGEWAFVLPNTTRLWTDSKSMDYAVFQNADLHLKYGISIAGTGEEWREQIAAPFARNSNVILAVGQALAAPLTSFAGVPPGMFHIWCTSKFGKSLASAVGQSIYGPPLIPNEVVPDPFGHSWLSTANAIGQIMRVRSSLPAFLDEINLGDPKAIADAAYRISNGTDKARMKSGGGLEPPLTYCVPSFSTGEEPMVSILRRNGMVVTEGMRTRIADVPAEVQPKSAFEEYSASEIVGLGKKYYRLLGWHLHGAVGDEWVSRIVDLVNQDQAEFEATIDRHQREFLARAKVQALYNAAVPWQRSVLTRFATAAAACRMAIDNGVLPWTAEDTDAGIERCVERWADKIGNDTDAVVSVPVAKVNAVVVDRIVEAIVSFMGERQSWEGTASELATALGDVVGKSAKSLGRWLSKEHAQRELRSAGFKIVKSRKADLGRGRRVRIERLKAE